jgi:hypothetical protein
LALAGGPGAAARGQGGGPAAAGLTVDPVYQQIKAFALTGGTSDVSNFVLKRDRMEMTFNGTFFFGVPVNGHVTGAVFVGQGTVHADAPPSPGDFEKDSMRRLLGADVLESDFKTVVLRMTDDTFDVIKSAMAPRTVGAPAGASAQADAQSLAAKFEPRLLRETGLNLSARLATSILNNETPGVFFAEFDGGRRGRFDFVLDHQTRVLASNFNVNGGEEGLVFTYVPGIFYTDIWMAFYALEDYQPNHIVPYADANNVVDITHYDLDIDLHTPGSKMGVTSRIDMSANASNLRVIPFKIGESLGTYQDARLNRQLRLKSASIGGQPVTAVQEDWEGGFTVYLPAPLKAGDKLTLSVAVEGNFLRSDLVPECFYLYSNESWYPRHGELDRATFDLTFHHLKRQIVMAMGTRGITEGPDPARADYAISTFKMEQPVAIAAFALGQFERSKQMSTSASGEQKVPLEFSVFSQHSTRTRPIRSDFILAEMDNAVRYFSQLFGPYPYPQLSAVLHPYGFGQGFPGILFLAPADTGDYHAMSFIAHETSHQWWGHVVLWRSYRDQWISEGFADYSAMLYVKQRDTQQPDSQSKLILEARDVLRASPRTSSGGIGKGRVADIGPIILGYRLSSSKSEGAPQGLIYSKGALVLRMVHFLLTNPANGNGDAFPAMMKTFVEKYRNGSASTEQFFQVASEYFAKSPIAARYNLPDLKEWFLRQWVYQAGFPSYHLDYDLQVQPDNTCIVTGTLRQEGVPDNWVMPLPIVFTMADKKVARTTVLAQGPSAKVQLKLPSKPIKVELDPDNWVLSDKTTAKGK